MRRYLLIGKFAVMRIFLILPPFFMIAHLLLGSGCSNIDVPLRDGDEGPGASSKMEIQVDRSSILDTEPLVLSVEGATGTVHWEAEPGSGHRFEPPSGRRVVFFPPNITGELEVMIRAEDESGLSDTTAITIRDEGEPPAPGEVLINEIGWAGTLTSAYDEYVELINRSARPLYLHNWRISSGGGTGVPLGFSGRIEQQSILLITNYDGESEKTAIACDVRHADPSLALANTAFGPFELLNDRGEAMDTVGDGGAYTYGTNSADLRASMARYTWSDATSWDPAHWYTESVSVNLLDDTRGSPGAPNSDLPLGGGVSEDDAVALITEYAVDPQDGIGEDWAELYVLREGSLRNFVLTDLDGEDVSITRGADIRVSAGEYWLVIWHDYGDEYDFDASGYLIEGARLYIADNPPTGTKDQIVLLCGGQFLDGLCYYTEGNDPFDNDEQQMRRYGWEGDPVLGKHGVRISVSDGDSGYLSALTAETWSTDPMPSPGEKN
jgi:hypothetical protein